MKDSDFLNRLQQEIPRWVAKGLIPAQNEAAILASVNQNNKPAVKPSFFVFSFLGMSLLAVGIILFFSSNWPFIPKIAKLALLFGALWASYITAGYLLVQKSTSPTLQWFAQLLLMLGVVIFGTNIWLIAQIYHIDAHFPNGLLIWSLGALLVAVLLRNQASIVLSLILALIWSETESQYFLRSIHWMFIPIFLLNIIPIIRAKWNFALHIALITLILWLTNNILWLNYPFYGIDQPNYFTFYFGLCSIGALITWILSVGLHHKKEDFAYNTIQHYAIFFFLLNLFYLTFPEILKTTKLLSGHYLGLNLTFSLSLFLAYGWFCLSTNQIARHILTTGALLIIALTTMLLLNYYALNHSILGMGFNLLFIGFMLWFIALGYELREIIYINLAFLFFAIFVIARYFDVFWDLLNRSLFFMVGGIVLLLGSYILEKKRRTLTRDIKSH